MADSLNYRVVDIDLTTAHNEQEYPVGAHEMTVTVVDSPAYARINTPDAPRVRLQVGTIRSRELIERIFITNDAGAGDLQIVAGGSVCVDFNSAAPEAAEFKETFHLIRAEDGLAMSNIWRRVLPDVTLLGIGDINGLSSGGVGNIAAQYSATRQIHGAYVYGNPGAAGGYVTGGFVWPLFNIFAFQARPALYPYSGMPFGRAIEVSWDSVVEAVQGTAAGAGLVRAVAGIGRASADGNIIQLVGIGFIADIVESPYWQVSISPYNDAISGEDPYYDRATTDILWNESHRLAIRFGERNGDPVAQFIIDGRLVHEYSGRFVAGVGSGLPAAIDGTFGGLLFSETGFSFGISKRPPDGIASILQYIDMGNGIAFKYCDLL